MTSAVEFRYLNAELYRHPAEREARKRMESIPGFNKALAMLTDNSGASAERQAEIASMARVGPGVYPALNDLWNEVQNTFGLNGIPLHLGWNPAMPCSLRGGNDHPTVILDPCLLEHLPEKEMFALLAMQAGSIRLGNATLLAASDFMRWFMDFYGIAGMPALLPAWGMENWRRQAMFSADRAAALAGGGPEAVSALLLRLAGAGSEKWGGVARPDDLRVQGLEALSLDSDWSNSKMRRFALAMNRQNTVALVRRVDLLDWFSGGDPDRIFAGEMTEPAAGGAKTGAASGGTAGVKDPSLAYWGEFAGCCGGKDGDGEAAGDKDGCVCPMCELKNMAGKGLSSFMKAGEAFWTTFTDTIRK